MSSAGSAVASSAGTSAISLPTLARPLCTSASSALSRERAGERIARDTRARRRSTPRSGARRRRAARRARAPRVPAFHPRSGGSARSTISSSRAAIPRASVRPSSVMRYVAESDASRRARTAPRGVHRAGIGARRDARRDSRARAPRGMICVQRNVAERERLAPSWLPGRR